MVTSWCRMAPCHSALRWPLCTAVSSHLQEEVGDGVVVKRGAALHLSHHEGEVEGTLEGHREANCANHGQRAG